MENQNMMQKPPKNWLVESILATIFCCLPLGIVGIVNATKVDKLFYAGDVAGANKAAADAARWTKLSFWIGIGLTVLLIVLQFALGVAIFSSMNDSGAF